MHPEDYEQKQGARFLVSFEKHRGIYGAAVEPFLADLHNDGWAVHDLAGLTETAVANQLVELVQLADAAGERMKSANQTIAAAKVRRDTGLRAWAALKKTGTIAKHPAGGFYAP